MSVEFDATNNVYILRIKDIKKELTREEAVLLQNDLTKCLKKTPVLFSSIDKSNGASK